ncbi:helix-turn-helix domain-containing protein [Cupriavidus necator]
MINDASIARDDLSEPPGSGEGMPIDQAARHCGVSVGMLSKLENGKGVNLEHVLRVLDGLGLMMLVVPKAHPIGSKRLRPMRPRPASWQRPVRGAAWPGVQRP